MAEIEVKALVTAAIRAFDADPEFFLRGRMPGSASRRGTVREIITRHRGQVEASQLTPADQQAFESACESIDAHLAACGVAVRP